MSQRFFAIYMLASGHGVGGDDGVRVVRRSDHHGIGRLEHLVVHLTVVVELLGRRITFENVVGVFPVDVAQADDVLALQALQHRSAASADADAQDIEFVAGGRVAELLTQNRAGYDR